MNEEYLRRVLDRVQRRRLSRRAFIELMAGVGIAAPLASQMLASVGIAAAQAPAPFVPTKRGGGGSLKVLMWSAPTMLNPELAVGAKDLDASRMFYEPLASFDSNGDLVPVLAREVPTVQNGGVASDGTSVTWKLKPDVRWHDGAPFTADDVVFTAQYISDPATGSPQSLRFREVERVQALDSTTVKVSFKQPTPFPWGVFCGLVMTIPRHVFEPYKGSKSREAPANLKPVGTGPYRYVDFKPGDLVKAEINPGYHVPQRPFFDAVEIKGGGDAVSAARAVLQTGDYDYAPYMSGVEDDILRRLETRGRGKLDFVFAGDLTHIQLNQTDPWTEIDGERSSLKTVHPSLTDPAVRTALGLLVDRRAIQEQTLGRTGIATGNWLTAPPRFESKNTRWEFSVEKANQVLDAAGWKRGPDGIRTRDGKKLKMVFQTAVNTVAQKMQAIVKQAAARAGIEIEVKAITAAIFFGSGGGNRDSYTQFNADLQLITYFQSTPDAERFMSLFTSSELPSRENGWQHFNVPRWRSDEYDALFRAGQTEMDPVKRAAIFIRMNDLLVQSGAIIPVARRATVSAIASTLKGAELSAWDRPFWRLPYWYREG